MRFGQYASRQEYQKNRPALGKRAWGKEETWNRTSSYLFFFLAFFFAAINLFTSIGKPKRASNGQNIGPCRICGTICSSFKSFCQEKSVEKVENGILEGLRGVEKFPSGSRASIILTGPDPGK